MAKRTKVKQWNKTCLAKMMLDQLDRQQSKKKLINPAADLTASANCLKMSYRPKHINFIKCETEITLEKPWNLGLTLNVFR